jgi:hypothetical protein
VATGHNGEGGRSLFCRFLTAAPTHRHALAPNLFPAMRPAVEPTVNRLTIIAVIQFPA